MQLTKYIESIYGDNMKHMKSCSDNQYDWGFCDPNFGIGASRTSEKNNTVLQKNGTRLKIKQTEYHQKDWDDKPPPNEYFDEVKRITRKQIIWGANYYDYNLKGGRLIWDKLNGTNDQMDCEIAYLSFTNRTDIVYYLWSGMFQGKEASQDVRIAITQEGDKRKNEKRIHQNQKPIKLCKWILDKYIKEGDSVFDSHSGSLSLAIACHLKGVHFTGCENDIDHYSDSENRVNNIFSTEGKLCFT